ncbi:hypothetical protein HY522_02325 [bacterium]|nr:hypothetical protein [bacterium]
MPIAPYETEYHRLDEPAYHPTVVKRWVALIAGGAGDAQGVQAARWAVLHLRVIALIWLLGLAHAYLGAQAGIAAFILFCAAPPSLTYLVRLDSWMDSVCFAVISMFLISAARARPAGRFWIYFLGGLFGGLAVDAKLTSLLTLVPAAPFLLWRQPLAVFGILTAGFLAAFGLSHPAWILDPARAFAHVTYWRATNALQPAFGAGYPFLSLAGSLPAVFIGLAVWGAVHPAHRRAAQVSALLAAVPLIFFMVYRTFPPDGVRHFYPAIPFLAALAGLGYATTDRRVRWGLAAAMLAELWFREF